MIPVRLFVFYLTGGGDHRYIWVGVCTSSSTFCPWLPFCSVVQFFHRPILILKIGASDNKSIARILNTLIVQFQRNKFPWSGSSLQWRHSALCLSSIRSWVTIFSSSSLNRGPSEVSTHFTSTTTSLELPFAQMPVQTAPIFLLSSFVRAFVSPFSWTDSLQDETQESGSPTHSSYWSIKWYGGRGRFDTY